jgi:hypothetical protein
MADIGLSAFSLFFMGSPSFLAHQRVLEKGHGRSGTSTLDQRKNDPQKLI